MTEKEESVSEGDSATSFDRLFKAWLGRLTLGVSPAGLMLA